VNELLPYIERDYPTTEFTLDELLRKLPFKKSKTYSLLKELIKMDKITKIAEGVYKLKEASGIAIPKEIITLAAKLKGTITRKFKFTALSILLPFAHHTPYSVVYSLYVEKGSGEDFKEAIAKINPEIISLLNPEKSDILLLMNEAKKNMIIAIRENSYFYGKEAGMAHLDTAFVDLYFEVSRDKIPFMATDVKEILKELMSKDLINYSRLMRYAHDRKLTSEIKKIALDLSKEIKLPRKGLDVLRKIP
jgi:hypothetical protein